MALVTLSEALSFLELSADDSYNTVQTILNGVISFTKRYCNRDFESTSYQETHDINGSYLITNQFPIISISKIAKNRISVAQIKNTNEFTYANVTASSTGITLNYNGSSSTLTYATYTTVGSLVTAINAVGSGWYAIVGAGYSSVLSTEINQFLHKNAINSNYIDLDIFGTSINVTNYDKDVGEINFDNEINGEVYINYTAGYSATPTDLKTAILIWMSTIYVKHQETSLGLSSYLIEKMEKNYDRIPSEVKIILDSYRKINI